MTSDCRLFIAEGCELWSCRAPPVDPFLNYNSFMKFADITLELKHFLYTWPLS